MPTSKNVLLLGASRGIGLAMAGELVARGWQVTATVRGTGRTELYALAERSGGALSIEHVDIAEPIQVEALRHRLSGQTFDLLFVNAAITNGDVEVGEVPTDTFVSVMVTNALSPMRVVEALQDLVTPTGTIGVMSSSQGSIALNGNGGHEVYRASKSALNQLMRSFAARHADDPRTLLLVNPGWIQTQLGGEGAIMTIEEAVPQVVDTIESRAGRGGGLHFVDWQDRVVPW